MEEDVKAGIALFETACQKRMPGVTLVIPVRPTGANYLISFSWQGFRSYDTLHEDALADWSQLAGDSELPQEMSEVIERVHSKLAAQIATAPAKPSVVGS